jgi:hypothetical protein
MKRRSLAPANSLDLLLDTMCNTFGGIILIALLVALLARQGGPQPEASPSSALFDQRIALAENERATLIAHLAEHAADDLSGPAAAVDAAEKALADARAAEKAIASGMVDRVEQIAASGGKAWSDLAGEIRRIERRRTELVNLIAGTEAEIARLKERQAALAGQSQRERDMQTVRLRFPKERPSTKKSWPVICKYGRIYPLYATGGVLDRTNITWRNVDSDSKESDPRPDRGLRIPEDLGAWRALLTTVRAEGLYVAFYVYPDSYDAFRVSKEAAVESRYEYGLETVPAGRKLTWGSKGSSPPPL